jgi:hypothetical protein
MQLPTWTIAGALRCSARFCGSAGLGRPTKTAANHIATMARMKWVIEPADITTVRFHTGKRHIARG